MEESAKLPVPSSVEFAKSDAAKKLTMKENCQR
jgi:hypothetical protein